MRIKIGLLTATMLITACTTSAAHGKSGFEGWDKTILVLLKQRYESLEKINDAREVGQVCKVQFWVDKNQAIKSVRLLKKSDNRSLNNTSILAIKTISTNNALKFPTSVKTEYVEFTLEVNSELGPTKLLSKAVNTAPPPNVTVEKEGAPAHSELDWNKQLDAK